MRNQANIQGVYDERVDHLNEFRRIMTDINLEHHLISQDALVMLLNRSFDMYEDISAVSKYFYIAEGSRLADMSEEGVAYLIDDDGNFVYSEGEKVVVEPFVKKVLLTKSPEMSYVQKTFSGFLVENFENYPYLVQLTSTDMPRMLNLGDRLLMGDILYEVRLVSPINRLNDSVQKVMVCPVLFSDVPVVEEVEIDKPLEVDPSYKKPSLF